MNGVSDPKARSLRARQLLAPSARNVICVSLIAAIALIAFQCVRLAMAGLLVQRAQAEADRWTLTMRTPDKSELRRANRHFTDSLAYVSDNPWALEGLGAVYLARMRASTNAQEALALTRDARIRFLQALERRPTSPFLWANLALTKLYLAEADEEMMNALRRAAELGPWEPTVQQTTVFVGLAVWEQLPSALQAELRSAIARGARRHPEKMLKIAKSYTRFDLVCAIEQYRRISGKDCADAVPNSTAQERNS